MAAPGSDYANLLRQVKAAGLLQRRHGYYLTTIAVTGGLYIAAWTVFALLGDSWWQLTVAAFLAVIFTQIGFPGHDAGHRQIFRSKHANDLADRGPSAVHVSVTGVSSAKSELYACNTRTTRCPVDVPDDPGDLSVTGLPGEWRCQSRYRQKRRRGAPTVSGSGRSVARLPG
ncbi:fatty acid desaturase family protein [Dactylosporangium cerinum]|uniref:Fatty acid desaturase family protein n=1 Tax=Dactylosporangium cerinum TaxID=1434730 RepID=A0ABV9VJN2_9ACTN